VVLLWQERQRTDQARHVSRGYHTMLLARRLDLASPACNISLNRVLSMPQKMDNLSTAHHICICAQAMPKAPPSGPTWVCCPLHGPQLLLQPLIPLLLLDGLTQHIRNRQPPCTAAAAAATAAPAAAGQGPSSLCCHHCRVQGHTAAVGPAAAGVADAACEARPAGVCYCGCR
jgi:hypothetical protein